MGETPQQDIKIRLLLEDNKIFLFSFSSQTGLFQGWGGFFAVRLLKAGVLNAPECRALQEAAGDDCLLSLQLNRDCWLLFMPPARSPWLDVRGKTLETATLVSRTAKNDKMQLGNAENNSALV